MGFPIPRHLKKILIIDEKKSDMHNIKGLIRCTCGCEKFRIMQNENSRYDEDAEWGELPGMKVNAVCNGCGKKLLLFDEAVHGYDGLVCHGFKTINDSDARMIPLKCKKCGADIFGITMSIEAADKEQFIEECVNYAPDEFSAEDYVDAFNWIVIATECGKCGYQDEWIDLELA